MRANFSEHVMPSGAVCWFQEADDDGVECHRYYKSAAPRRKRDPDGAWKGVGRLAGVTTVVAPMDFRPDALMKWAARSNGEGIAVLVRDLRDRLSAEASAYGAVYRVAEQLEWLCDAGTIWRRLRDEELTYDDLREARAEEGTNVHKHALYALASGKPLPDYHELTEAEQGYAQGVAQFWLDHTPEPEGAEQVVCDLALGVAGRLDYRGWLTTCYRAECGCHAAAHGPRFFALVDAKTSGYISTKAHGQMAGYEALSRWSGYGTTEAQLILQVDEGGGYELVPARAVEQDFRRAVDLYRRVQKINSQADRDRKAREAANQEARS